MVSGTERLLCLPHPSFLCNDCRELRSRPVWLGVTASALCQQAASPDLSGTAFPALKGYFEMPRSAIGRSAFAARGSESPVAALEPPSEFSRRSSPNEHALLQRLK